MSTFPVTVIDNFLDDIDEVLNIAKSVEYTEPGYNYYPGSISKKKLHEIDNVLNNKLMAKLSLIFWDLNDSFVSWDSSRIDFMKLKPLATKDNILNVGMIHHDNEEYTDVSGILYLNRSSQKDCGTSFYDCKVKNYKFTEELTDVVKKFHGGDEVPNLVKTLQSHFNCFDETIRVQNKFNRLCVYSPDVWHGVTNYGEENRYTMRIFASYKNRSPLQR